MSYKISEKLTALTISRRSGEQKSNWESPTNILGVSTTSGIETIMSDLKKRAHLLRGHSTLNKTFSMENGKSRAIKAHFCHMLCQRCNWRFDNELPEASAEGQKSTVDHFKAENFNESFIYKTIRMVESGKSVLPEKKLWRPATKLSPRELAELCYNCQGKVVKPFVKLGSIMWSWYQRLKLIFGFAICVSMRLYMYLISFS